MTKSHQIFLIKGYVCDQSVLDKAFIKYYPMAVLHFAGSKVVKESIKNPLIIIKIIFNTLFAYYNQWKIITSKL